MGIGIKKMSRNIIRSFVVNEVFFYHVIDLTDDTITLYDEDHNLLLKYDSGCSVKNADDQYVGSFNIKGGYENGIWQFQFTEEFGGAIIDGKRCILGEGLIDSEVMVSIHYINLMTVIC